jgi:hypothetical protein
VNYQLDFGPVIETRGVVTARNRSGLSVCWSLNSLMRARFRTREPDEDYQHPSGLIRGEAVPIPPTFGA